MKNKFAFLRILFCVFFATPFSFCVTSSNEALVTNCYTLQHALNNDTIMKVLIQGHITCSRQNWHHPVVLHRNVEVTTAQTSKQGGRITEVDSIDWTDSRNVLIVERGALLHVHDLLIEQEAMGVTGLTLAFLQTRKGATGIFTGLVFRVRMCPESLGSYSEIFNALTRPRILSGEQKSKALRNDVLWIQNVAIWWPNLNSLWQLCNSVFICASDEDAIPIPAFFNTGVVSSTCDDTTNTETDLFDLLNNVSEQTPTHRNQSKNTAFLVIVVSSSTLILALAFSYCIFVWNRGQTEISSATLAPERPWRIPTSESKDLGNEICCLEGPTGDILAPFRNVEIGQLMLEQDSVRIYRGNWNGIPVTIKRIQHGEHLICNSLRLPFEAYLSRHLSHPNVIQTFMVDTHTTDDLGKMASKSMELDLKGAISDSEKSEKYVTWLLQEYCSFGTLSDAIQGGLFHKKDHSNFAMDWILQSALEVANALNYLHSLDVLHGNLNAHNVLLKQAASEPRGFVCKLSDFGLSRFLGTDVNSRSFNFGLITHTAPELLREGALSLAVDVYSFGMFLWELLARNPPFADLTEEQVFFAVIEGRRPQMDDHYPQEYAELIKECWKQNPEDRLNFKEIIKCLKMMLIQLQKDKTLNFENLRNSENKDFMKSEDQVKGRVDPVVQGGDRCCCSLSEFRNSKKWRSSGASFPGDLVAETSDSVSKSSTKSRSSSTRARLACQDLDISTTMKSQSP